MVGIVMPKNIVNFVISFVLAFFAESERERHTTLVVEWYAGLFTIYTNFENIDTTSDKILRKIQKEFHICTLARTLVFVCNKKDITMDTRESISGDNHKKYSFLVSKHSNMNKNK